MKARYSKLNDTKNRCGKLKCNFCSKFDWFIVIERGGAKEDFKICSHCGNKVEDE